MWPAGAVGARWIFGCRSAPGFGLGQADRCGHPSWSWVAARGRHRQHLADTSSGALQRTTHRGRSRRGPRYVPPTTRLGCACPPTYLFEDEHVEQATDVAVVIHAAGTSVGEFSGRDTSTFHKICTNVDAHLRDHIPTIPLVANVPTFGAPRSLTSRYEPIGGRSITRPSLLCREAY